MEPDNTPEVAEQTAPTTETETQEVSNPDQNIEVEAPVEESTESPTQE